MPTQTLPVMCSRQIRNRQLRDLDVYPVLTYHTQVGPGDVVRVHLVERDPKFSEAKFDAVVRGVDDHGHYLNVHYELVNGSTNGLGTATLFREGPPDWGVIEFRVVRKVHRPLLPDPKKRI